MANTIKHLCKKNSVGFNSIKPNTSIFNINCRMYASTLFVPGNKANKAFVYLSPNLDYSNRFKDIKKLQNELDQRGAKFDVQGLSKSWEYYQYILSNKDSLEEKVTEFGKKLAKIYKIENPSPDQEKKKESMTHQIHLARQDLRAMKEAVWEVEESIMPEILKLPNELDERTPPETAVVLKSVGEKPVVSNDRKQSHLDIGKRLDLLDYKNPIQCYLCNKAAFFELEALSLASEILIKHGFIRSSNPDFCRSMIIEGSGLDHESISSSFILQDNDDEPKDELISNRLHLVGGASLPALLAAYTKHSLKPTAMPMRIFSSGRHYAPTISGGPGLFSTCQASAIQALTLFGPKNAEEHETELQKLIDATSEFYDSLGCHYRIVIQPAPQLELAESMRLSYEMWAVHADRYIEVGNISLCGDYLSKRLMIVQKPSNGSEYPSAITGNLLSVPRVLGCLIEENPDEFVLPEKLKRIFG